MKTDIKQTLEVLSYDDIELGMELISESYHMTLEEIVSFAAQWDPEPYHIDVEAAKNSVFGRLVACGMHVNSVRGLLRHRMPVKLNMLAGLAANSTVLPNPVYPGDTLQLTERFIDKRLSKSKSDRGIVTSNHIVTNQHGDVVMQLEAVVMMAVAASTRRSHGGTSSE